MGVTRIDPAAPGRDDGRSARHRMAESAGRGVPARRGAAGGGDRQDRGRGASPSGRRPACTACRIPARSSPWTSRLPRLRPRARLRQPFLRHLPPKSSPRPLRAVAGPKPEDGATPLRASPLARRLARDAGLDVTQISGTGRRGRIMGDDVRALRARTANSADGPISVRRLPPRGEARVPVVLLHGLYDEGRGWRDLPDRLARAGHGVLVPDLPGHGGSRGVAETPRGGRADAGQDPARGAASAGGPFPRRGAGDPAGRGVGGARGAPRAARTAGPWRTDQRRFPRHHGGRRNDRRRSGRAMALLGGGPMSDAALQIELDRLRSAGARRCNLWSAPSRPRACSRSISRRIWTGLSAPVTAVFGLGGPDPRLARLRGLARLGRDPSGARCRASAACRSARTCGAELISDARRRDTGGRQTQRGIARGERRRARDAVRCAACT